MFFVSEKSFCATAGLLYCSSQRSFFPALCDALCFSLIDLAKECDLTRINSKTKFSNKFLATSLSTFWSASLHIAFISDITSTSRRTVSTMTWLCIVNEKLAVLCKNNFSQTTNILRARLLTFHKPPRSFCTYKYLFLNWI